MWFPTCGWGDGLFSQRIRRIRIRIIPILLILILIPRIRCIWRRGSAGGEDARLWQGAVGAGLLDLKELGGEGVGVRQIAVVCEGAV